MERLIIWQIFRCWVKVIANQKPTKIIIIRKLRSISLVCFNKIKTGKVSWDLCSYERAKESAGCWGDWMFQFHHLNVRGLIFICLWRHILSSPSKLREADGGSFWQQVRSCLDGFWGSPGVRDRWVMVCPYCEQTYGWMNNIRNHLRCEQRIVW